MATGVLANPWTWSLLQVSGLTVIFSVAQRKYLEPNRAVSLKNRLREKKSLNEGTAGPRRSSA
jgi:hypothetical protein